MNEKRRSFHNLSLSELFTVWHIIRGGVTDVDEITELSGVKLNSNALQPLVSHVDNMVDGPLNVLRTIRCCGCGGRITQIPCRVCGRAQLRML